MIIKSLELENFRNYETLSIDFDSGTNILFGDNAQGKTNILEAIFLSATTKSHKGSKDRDIIRFDAEEAHIRTYVVKDGLENRVDMHLRKNRSKGIWHNQRAEDQKGCRSAGTAERCLFFAGGSLDHQEWSGGATSFCRYGAVPAGQFLSVQSEQL